MFRSASPLLHGLAVVGCVLAIAPPARAQQWATLKGHLVVDGKMGSPAPVNADKDVAVCGKQKLVDEKVVVSPAGDLANAVVYVRDKSVEVSPEYAKTAKDEVVLDNKDCRFEPHVVILRTTQSLLLKNSDPVGHNTKVDLIKNDSFNDMLPASQSLKKTGLSKEETLPLNVSCSIHPWMNAVILIRNNPYAEVSKADGTFEIKDLPAGVELEFQFWQEKAGNLKNIKNDKDFATDGKGRVKLTLKPGVTDLGTIKIPSGAFER